MMTVTKEVRAVAAKARNAEYTRAKAAGEPRDEDREFRIGLEAAFDYVASQHQPVAQGEAVAWFPTLEDGSILRHFSDGTPVPANITKEGAEKSRLFHLGTSGNPVVPLFATPTIPAGYRLVADENGLAFVDGLGWVVQCPKAVEYVNTMQPWRAASPSAGGV